MERTSVHQAMRGCPATQTSLRPARRSRGRVDGATPLRFQMFSENAMRVPLMRSLIYAVAVGATFGLANLGFAEDLQPRFRAVVDKGLDYLAKNQARDGHWEGNGGQYPTTITALCG